MQISYIRSSSYNSHTICEMQYYLTYVLGWPENVGVAMEKGTITHHIFEIFGKAKLADQNNKKIISDNVLGRLNIFAKSRPYTTNKFVDYIIPPIFNYYNEKDNMDFGAKELKEITKWVYAVIEDGTFDARNLPVLSTELHFELPIEQDWAKLPDGEYLKIKGTMDLILDHGDYWEIMDYKTGGRTNWTLPYPRRKTFEDFMNDFQSDLYFYAINKIYPEHKDILITIAYINDGGGVTTTRDESDIEKIEEKIRKKFELIKKCDKPRLKSLSGEHFFCSKICTYGKNFIKGKTQCQYATKILHTIGMEQATAKLKEKGFSIDNYNRG